MALQLVPRQATAGAAPAHTLQSLAPEALARHADPEMSLSLPGRRPAHVATNEV